MLALWTDQPPQNALGTLTAGHGRPLRDLPDAVPVFMMFGRMDPCQKGFDVMARAIELLEPGSARFVLTPDVGGGVEAFTEDLRRLVQSRPGEVLCVLGRMERGYLETMAGATYCVLPSLYEPFGGATEPYLKGTPVVARATGGLVQQVVDLRQDRSGATGLLYREHFVGDSDRATGLLWRELLECGDPRERCRNRLYAALVENLARALVRAIEVYQRDPDGYAIMLSNLHRQALRFSWEQAADEYGMVYDLATE
jgi:glycogen synthase